MEEFSDYVGLSRQTVSRYFNDPNSVRRQTREAIEKAHPDAGWRLADSRDGAPGVRRFVEWYRAFYEV